MDGKDTRDALHEAMQQPAIDWIDDPGVRIETGPNNAVSVYSARMPAEWSDELAAETIRRDLDNPGELIQALVREGLDRARTRVDGADDAVLAALADVQVALDKCVAWYRSEQQGEAGM